MVDHQYPLNFAQLAKRLQIPHFGLLTSTSADATSMFFYMQVKGEVERDVKALDLAQLTIYQPGCIENRRNDNRFGETIVSFIPFIKKIQARDLGESILLHAIERTVYHPIPQGDDNMIMTLSNNQIRDALPTLRQSQAAQPNL